MFTGIIEKTAQIASVDHLQGDMMRTVIRTRFTDLALGESVAINGVCLTVVEADQHGTALFFISPETVRCTNLGTLKTGAWVNVERALQMGARLSGHWVQGHVDGKAKLVEQRFYPAGDSKDESIHLKFELDPKLSRYCIEKGSICLDGISLTVNSVETTESSAFLNLMIIPHTWKNTNLAHRQLGDEANVEVDVLAKYVERLCQIYPKP